MWKSWDSVHVGGKSFTGKHLHCGVSLTGCQSPIRIATINGLPWDQHCSWLFKYKGCWLWCLTIQRSNFWALRLLLINYSWPCSASVTAKACHTLQMTIDVSNTASYLLSLQRSSQWKPQGNQLNLASTWRFWLYRQSTFRSNRTM